MLIFSYVLYHWVDLVGVKPNL